jgi:hypothetical protein
LLFKSLPEVDLKLRMVVSKSGQEDLLDIYQSAYQFKSPSSLHDYLDLKCPNLITADNPKYQLYTVSF